MERIAPDPQADFPADDHESHSTEAHGAVHGTRAGGRAYRKAQQDRGLETRQRLIEAGLDVFGRYGFEAATTRQIAKAADANLAAILYHFGSKEALYRAVAEHIVAQIADRFAPGLAILGQMIDGLTREQARPMLVMLFGRMVDQIVGTTEAERWSRFMLREQLDPTAAFDVLYGFIGPVHGQVTRLVAIAAGLDAETEEAKLLTFTLMGQVVVFRCAQTMVLRRLGRTSFQPADKEAIKRQVTDNALALLDATAARHRG